MRVQVRPAAAARDVSAETLQEVANIAQEQLRKEMLELPEHRRPLLAAERMPFKSEGDDQKEQSPLHVPPQRQQPA